MLATREFFTWCCERLRAASAIAEIIPSGSFARGTCIRPLHDIDALVRFDLNELRKAGVHDGTNLQLMFFGDVLKCLAPQHQIRGACHVESDGADAAGRAEGVARSSERRALNLSSIGAERDHRGSREETRPSSDGEHLTRLASDMHPLRLGEKP